MALRPLGTGAMGWCRADACGASDPSLGYAGACRRRFGHGRLAEFPLEEVRALGQINRRWRLRMPAAAGAPPPSKPRRFAAFESGEPLPPAPCSASSSECAGETGHCERRPKPEGSGVKRSVMAPLPAFVQAHTLVDEESLGDLLAWRCRPLSALWLPTSSSSSSRMAKASRTS